MIFKYPDKRLARRHGPSGYRDYASYKPWLRDDFTFTCIFCLVRERWYPNGHAAFSVEHLAPKVLGQSVLDYDNLLYSCLQCNSLKRALTGILDPCKEGYGAHIVIHDDGAAFATTKRGSILIDTFRLNDGQRVRFRREFLEQFEFLSRTSHDLKARALFSSFFGFPRDLPDLRKNKPPKNSRPHGVNTCYFVQRELGLLPGTY